MQSFRTEIENPVVEKDIIDLEKKIRLFREGTLNEEKFRSLRLARGVYGQRQQGVQMVRIKLPFGRLTVQQMLRIADISDEYATGNLHLTTRQDIQIHYVSLESTPELWAKLDQDHITIREACGNTVRNITGSSIAGIDPLEPFDISPYAHGMFQYFLRNPVCQEMGRKFKISFSSNDQDTGLSFIHDLGFLPRVKIENGKEVRGFKVMIGGGLGSQPYLAQVAYEFLHEDVLVPFTEGVLRVFDRYGERNRRHKARMKYLINDIGLEALLELVEKERIALKSPVYKVDRNSVPEAVAPEVKEIPAVSIQDQQKYEAWLKTNVFEQRQKGYYAVQIKILLGDLPSTTARKLAPLVRHFAADDIRITVNQGLLLKFVSKEALGYLFNELEKIGLADPGFDSTVDITACPGTDTCNLGISSSTGIARELERVMKEEYPDLIFNSDIKIKISGCINACGQHTIANIGFHGSSSKKNGQVYPALQVMIGGGVQQNGKGSIADKITKVPSKRGPDVLRYLLNDYQENSLEGEYFNDYYRRQGKDYFYQLLKPLASSENLVESDFVDWGFTEKFETAIGVGECAGVMIDLVSTLLYESEEKVTWAKEALEAGAYTDSIYHSYNALVSTAKAYLLSQDITCNTQAGIINDFDTHVVSKGLISLPTDFKDLAYQINQNLPTKEFAESYFSDAVNFYNKVASLRKAIQENEKASVS
ncbi:nitrite/sulfite reductase [soil metagenome]